MTRGEFEAFCASSKQEEQEQVWLAPRVVAPHFLMFAASQWVIWVNARQHLWFHAAHNELYQCVLLGKGEHRRRLPGAHKLLWSAEAEHVAVAVLDGARALATQRYGGAAEPALRLFPAHHARLLRRGQEPAARPDQHPQFAL